MNVPIEETYWQLGERRVADMSTEHLLLELQQLDHQAGQRLVGGGLGLDVLGGRREAISAEQQGLVTFTAGG